MRIRQETASEDPLSILSHWCASLDSRACRPFETAQVAAHDFDRLPPIPRTGTRRRLVWHTASWRHRAPSGSPHRQRRLRCLSWLLSTVSTRASTASKPASLKHLGRHSSSKSRRSTPPTKEKFPPIAEPSTAHGPRAAPAFRWCSIASPASPAEIRQERWPPPKAPGRALWKRTACVIDCNCKFRTMHKANSSPRWTASIRASTAFAHRRRPQSESAVHLDLPAVRGVYDGSLNPCKEHHLGNLASKRRIHRARFQALRSNFGVAATANSEEAISLQRGRATIPNTKAGTLLLPR